MNIQQATTLYEAWLEKHVPVISEDLDTKHREMKRSAAGFLRATFYRWCQRFPQVCERLMHAPEVLAAGDVHVNNFGTWRDSAGQLVWGLNDFDEAARMPYANDLVRLASSAILAVEGRVSVEALCLAILKGYEAAMLAKGRPLHPQGDLRRIIDAQTKRKKHFWADLGVLPDVETPAAVERLLRAALPKKGMKFRIVHRVSGLGSLGRQRFTAIAQGERGPVAREAKQLAASAWIWANGGRETVAVSRLLKTAVRAADPDLRVARRWIIRPLSPDHSRLDLEHLPGKKSFLKLLGAMAWETANIHLGSGMREKILVDLTLRRSTWLQDAALAMTEAVRSDWQDWRQVTKAARAAR